jgi:Zn-dependent oligopeptidase
MKMINKVSPILIKLSKKECDTLVNFWNLHELKEYDIAYYSNKLLKQKYNIDNNLVKEYFTPSYSIPKILSIYCKLFGLKCNLIKNYPKWHEDIFVYKFLDSKTNELMGYIYFDLYPRSKKYTHAMTTPLQNTYMINNNNNNNKQRIIPISAIVCNFDKKFMTIGEIETFCHEFGHGLHQILSKTQYELYAGTSTEADFAEMPSQLFENWCQEPSFLRKISSHYITHKKISLVLAKKIQKNKNFNNGLFYLRQILLSSYDLQVHSITNNQEITKDKLYNLWFELHNKLYSYPLEKNIYPMCRFEHLIGYEANYYSYMWTNIYAKDIFSQFKKNGIYDTKTGIKFRKEIFEKGGEVKGVEMIEGFLGRSVNENAFFEMFH